jgi:hypothetical protein
MNKKVGMCTSAITFLGALCFSIFIILSSLLDHTFIIGCHLSCILLALGFMTMICSYVTYAKDENKSIGLISFAFSIIYVIIIVILSVIGIIPEQYSNLSSETKSILLILETLGYTFMAISSFFIGIKLATKNKRELILKLLFCFKILFFIIWFILLKTLIFFENLDLSITIMIFEIWCVYIISIGIFSYLYFKYKQ